MPKVSVYLPQELYDRARKEQLPISKLAQEAIESALRRDATARWVKMMRSRPDRLVQDFDITELMDEVRSEWGT